MINHGTKFVNDNNGIIITAYAVFDFESSFPEDLDYVWVYTIKIENKTNIPVQILARSWNIIDSDGCIQEVHGIGVVGEQPVIEPGLYYEYSSKTSTHTPSGIMVGNYEVVNLTTSEVSVVIIPTFTLESPFSNNTIN